MGMQETAENAGGTRQAQSTRDTERWKAPAIKTDTGWKAQGTQDGYKAPGDTSLYEGTDR